jgi:hypothetical protein
MVQLCGLYKQCKHSHTTIAEATKITKWKSKQTISHHITQKGRIAHLAIHHYQEIVRLQDLYKV